jgi:hypothetical protein
MARRGALREVALSCRLAPFVASVASVGRLVGRDGVARVYELVGQLVLQVSQQVADLLPARVIQRVAALRALNASHGVESLFEHGHQ